MDQTVCLDHGILFHCVIACFLCSLKKVAVDLIDAWLKMTPHGELEFLALTCIDTKINLVEIV